MDKDLRASLSAAGAAAALSALVGIIAGVGFLVLILRALAFGLLFGAAAFGAITLLRRMVPEAVDPYKAAEAGELGDEAKGLNIDIVLPGESPDLEPADAAEPSFARAARREAFKRKPELADLVEVYGQADAEDLDEEISELEDASLLEPESPAEIEPAIPSDAPPDKAKRSPTGFDELDMLPDLDGFTDSFTGSEFALGGSASAGSERPMPLASMGGSTSSRGGQAGMDPATLAQAVRTILKRDQKG